MEELHESENPPPPQFVYVESTARLAGINDGQWLIMMLHSMLNMDDEYHENDPIYIHLFILMMNHLYHLYPFMLMDDEKWSHWFSEYFAPFWPHDSTRSLRNPVLSQILHSQLIAFQCRLERQDRQLPRTTLGQHQTWGAQGKTGRRVAFFGWVNDEDPLLWLIYPIIRPWLYFGYTVILCYTNVWEMVFWSILSVFTLGKW